MKGAPIASKALKRTLESIESAVAESNSQVVRIRLLRWAGRHGRSFVWRSWRDPYRLLVTEILLKQTRADAVAGVVGQLFGRYPTPQALAVAGHQLEQMIRPLGLVHQRAAQLRALALVLTDDPPTADYQTQDWRRLPGIGPYAAGMVAATLGARRAVAVDTNVARVVCRVFGLVPTHLEARKSTNVWQKTSDLVSGRSPIRTLWAVLDLAALVCIARNPRCQACPLRTVCVVGQQFRPKTGSETSGNPIRQWSQRASKRT